MNGTSLTLSLPATAPSSTWFLSAQNLNSTPLTINPNTKNINGQSTSLTIGPSQTIGIWTDGTNYFSDFPQLALRVSADVSNSQNPAAFADVTGLTWPVAASTRYSFHCDFSYTSAATTTALQLSINGPASPTAMRYSVLTATTATAIHAASQNAYDTVTNPGTGGGATALPVTISGMFENGTTAGTLAIRLKSEVNSSAVTVLQGSFCTVQRQ